MKSISKIIEIPASATINQMENALDNHLTNGYILVSIFTLSNKTYAVLVKTIAE